MQVYELEALTPERAARDRPARRRGARRPGSTGGRGADRRAGRRRRAGARSASSSSPSQTAAPGPVEAAHVDDAARKRPLLYDRGGDRHYDTISAWIKSTRASDVQASVYYLAVMLEGGEDARFIARRMIVLASEDIGNADPRALLVAVAAAQAVEHVGLPEARLNLAQAAVYLARAPKSNASYKALNAAVADVREHGHLNPPDALRSAAYPGASKLGRGKGYVYPHEDPAGLRRRLPPGRAQGPRLLHAVGKRRGDGSESRESGSNGRLTLGLRRVERESQSARCLTTLFVLLAVNRRAVPAHRPLGAAESALRRGAAQRRPADARGSARRGRSRRARRRGRGLVRLVEDRVHLDELERVEQLRLGDQLEREVRLAVGEAALHRVPTPGANIGSTASRSTLDVEERRRRGGTRAPRASRARARAGRCRSS